MARNIPPLLPLETKHKEGSQSNSAQFSGFSKVKNLYITGHSDGAINFWDVSCPFLTLLLPLKQQVIFSNFVLFSWTETENCLSVCFGVISLNSNISTASWMIKLRLFKLEHSFYNGCL